MSPAQDGASTSETRGSSCGFGANGATGGTSTSWVVESSGAAPFEAAVAGTAISCGATGEALGGSPDSCCPKLGSAAAFRILQKDRHRAGEIVRTSRTCRMNRIGDDEEPGPHPRVASPRSSRPEQTHRAEIELASRTTQGARQRHPTPPAPTPEDLCTAMIQEKLEQLRRDRDARATELAKRRDQDGPTTSDNSSSDDCRTKTQIPTEQHHAMDHHEESSDSDAPFQEVRRRRKGTKRRKAEENTRMQTESRAVPTTNYYAPLQKQDEPTADQHQLQPNDTTSQHTPAPPPPKPRIPPKAIHAYQLRPTPSKEPQQPPQPSFAATPNDFPSLRTPWKAASSLFQTPSEQQPTRQKNTARQRLHDLRQQQQQQRSMDNTLGLSDIIAAISNMGPIIDFLKTKNVFAIIADTARKFNNAPDMSSKLLTLLEGIMAFFTD
ncbi:cell surface glycoprotein 1-like [Schistocerca americana]|uniref:cell surface glycoprotein 1-like n=1 Tax=Schistocerca americana TaxID=7009 RepID=UPI001F4FD0AB|nr:cell surface glycoprotein 1-like [Schistocerca americana]